MTLLKDIKNIFLLERIMFKLKKLNIQFLREHLLYLISLTCILTLI
jgi:hypothetical protein